MNTSTYVAIAMIVLVAALYFSVIKHRKGKAKRTSPGTVSPPEIVAPSVPPKAPGTLKYPASIVDVDEHNFVLYKALEDSKEYKGCYFAANTLLMAGFTFDALGEWILRGNVGCLADGTFEQGKGFSFEGFESNGPNSELGKYSFMPPWTYVLATYAERLQPWRVAMFRTRPNSTFSAPDYTSEEIKRMPLHYDQKLIKRARLTSAPADHGKELLDYLRTNNIVLEPVAGPAFPGPH